MQTREVGQLRQRQREEQRGQKAVRTVLRGDDDKIHTGPLAGQQKVYIVVARDLIHQAALKDRQSVAETNDDVAPEVFFCFEEQAVRVFGRMLRREGS